MKSRQTAVLAAVLAVLVAMPVAFAAALAPNAKYTGKTSDGGALSLRLNGDASRIKRVRIHYTLTCADGRMGDTYTDILRTPVRKDHSFKASGTYRGSSDGSQNKFNLSGKLWKKKASGKFSLTSTGTVSGSKRTCKTGKLTWSAKKTK